MSARADARYLVELPPHLPVDTIEGIGKALALAEVKAVLFMADQFKFYELKDGK